jgi:hypothetical protein
MPLSFCANRNWRAKGATNMVYGKMHYRARWLVGLGVFALVVLAAFVQH